MAEFKHYCDCMITEDNRCWAINKKFTDGSILPSDVTWIPCGNVAHNRVKGPSGQMLWMCDTCATRSGYIKDESDNE